MSRKPRKSVGVIGLGIIGGRVAAGLRAAGFQVYVWNRSAKPAPNFLGSPAEIASSTDIIQIFVSDAAALHEVIESMSDVLTPKHVVVCNATVGPEAVIEAAQTVEARGALFLDAPFTGSKVAAEKRELVYYIGGSETAYLKARPVLEITSKSIVRMGEIGHASTVKVVTNMISAVTVQALAEALAIVQKAGLEPEILAAAIEQNACRSGVVDLKLPKMMAGDFEPHFSLKHMFKDVQLAIHMANALDLEVPTTTVTAGVMYGAINQGWGDLDFSSLFKNYGRPAGGENLSTLPRVMNAVNALAAGSAMIGEAALSASNESRETAAEREAEIEALASLLAATPVQSSLAAPAEEREPTPEAARIINAMSDFGHNGPMPVSASEPGRREISSSETKSAARAPAAEQPIEAATASEEAENPVRPTNFVRRWFVAR